jgi:hypothetical protein|tara:strand:- start:2184 stop:2363 length:180 start_codon:yes stop_codon:yes gene_type:complete
MTAFNEAWLLLKTQPSGLTFSLEEKNTIFTTLVKMMNSGDVALQEEAEMLFARYVDLQR